MAMNRIAGGKACNHQVSGSGTIPLSMVGKTISHYKILVNFGKGRSMLVRLRLSQAELAHGVPMLAVRDTSQHPRRRTGAD